MRTATTLLVFCIAALLALGMVMLYSASMWLPQDTAGSKLLAKQLVFCGVGLVAALVTVFVDYHLLRRFAPLLYLLGLLLVGAVLIPGIGQVHGNARRWFDVGPVQFQPSELMKLCLILGLAWYCDRRQRQMRGFGWGIVVPGLLVALPVGLVFPEPDVGTAILLGAIGLVIMLIAGARWVYIVPPVLIALAALGYYLWNNPMRSQRIYSWMHLQETKRDKGLQAYQAMVALGSGGVTGKGLGNGRQKLGWIPEHHTDFILSVIGEELGVAATLGVVVTFLIFVICGYTIAWNAPDLFGLLLAAGTTTLIGLQAFINIGVVTSALPNKGLPLPFISYGGSNLLIMLTAVGLLLSVARQCGTQEDTVTDLGSADDNPFARPT